ncbi:hypothetical protein [Tuberibacillus sp. Marseille-P3662]|uniref:hypothetical protein n=1 Tax=Tuberibacillus sp. Marseille-P3662 TaxID=1965358 RepID=UPI000A1CD2F0|nr:hypothetical protein [Tuberibacillus sp. Marseille-P3662]
MKQVIKTLRRTDAEKRIPVMRMEIDYELATLHEAIVNEDINQIEVSKQRLTELRREMLELEV